MFHHGFGQEPGAEIWWNMCSESEFWSTVSKCHALDTVEFHSIRMSRVTGPKISENFRTCHRSPSRFSNVRKKSQNREKCPEKSNFRARGAIGFGTQLWQVRKTANTLSTVRLAKLTMKNIFPGIFGGILQA